MKFKIGHEGFNPASTRPEYLNKSEVPNDVAAASPRLPHRRDRIVRRLEEVSDEASARVAARTFRAWALAEGLMAEEC